MDIGESDYLSLAQEFRSRKDYEWYLATYLGLHPGNPEWASAIEAFEFKQHILASQQPHNRPRRVASRERDLIVRMAEDRIIRVARASCTAADFSRFLREELGLTEGSHRFEAAMRAWTAFKRM